MGCQIGSIRVLHQKLVRASSRSAEKKKTARFWRGRETQRCISAPQDPLSAYSFFLEYPCHGDQLCLLLMVKKSPEQQRRPFPHAPECMEYTFSHLSNRCLRAKPAISGLYSIVKFSIKHATWRPPRGRLTARPEMDDMCNRVIREQATFPSIVRCIGGTSVAHSDGL